MFAQTCQACHAATPAASTSGSPASGASGAPASGAALTTPPGAAIAAPAAGAAVGPSLANLGARMAYEDFKQIVNVGRGHMPAFPSIDDDGMRALYGHLAGGSGGSGPMGDAREGGPGPGGATSLKPTGGPVVASGGAPGGADARRPAGFRPGAPPPYPEGVDAPSKRFYTGYGLSYPFILSPPWSSLVAYDLNTRRDQVARAARRGSRRGRGRREGHGPAARIAAHGDGRHVDRPRLRDGARRQGARLRCRHRRDASGRAICRTAPRAFRRCMPSTAASTSSSARPRAWCGDASRWAAASRG